MKGNKKKGRLFLAGFMAIMMLINLLNVSDRSNVSVSNAQENNWEDSTETLSGHIALSKTVTGYNPENGEFNIELKIENRGDVENNDKSLDVISCKIKCPLKRK